MLCLSYFYINITTVEFNNISLRDSFFYIENSDYNLNESIDNICKINYDVYLPKIDIYTSALYGGVPYVVARIWDKHEEKNFPVNVAALA